MLAMIEANNKLIDSVDQNVNNNHAEKSVLEENSTNLQKKQNDIGRDHNLSLFEMNRKDKTIQLDNIYPEQQYIWWWDDLTNTKPIEMTVALPAFNAEKIIWLALESLKNQININFAWELICFEEEAKSREIIKTYVGLLPGCVRIIHKNIDPNKGHYRNGKYTLLEKWISMAEHADQNSKIFVKHACDCYSPPKRLFIHYEHFKNPECYYSTQPTGYFYNIHTNQYCLYEGNKVIFKGVDNSKNLVCPHLNMALRTDSMKKIKLPPAPIYRGIDTYIFTGLSTIMKIDPNKKKIIFSDKEIDPDNWKYSLDTDGYNNISIKRKISYTRMIKPWMRPIKIPAGLMIPSYVMTRLKSLANLKK